MSRNPSGRSFRAVKSIHQRPGKTVLRGHLARPTAWPQGTRPSQPQETSAAWEDDQAGSGERDAITHSPTFRAAISAPVKRHQRQRMPQRKRRSIHCPRGPDRGAIGKLCRLQPFFGCESVHPPDVSVTSVANIRHLPIPPLQAATNLQVNGLRQGSAGMTMRRMIVVVVAVVCHTLVATPQKSFGQAFGVELQASVLPAAGGMGGAGIARPQDLQTPLALNPATLSQFKGTQFSFSGAWVEPTINLDNNDRPAAARTLHRLMRSRNAPVRSSATSE